MRFGRVAGLQLRFPRFALKIKSAAVFIASSAVRNTMISKFIV